MEILHAVISDELLKDQSRSFIARRPLRQVNPRVPVLLSKFACAFAPAIGVLVKDVRERDPAY